MRLQIAYTPNTFCFSVALRPDSRSWPPPTGLRIHAHWTHHTPFDSYGPVISPTQRSVHDNTNTHNIHLCLWRDPNLPSQEARGHWDRPQHHIRVCNKL